MQNQNDKMDYLIKSFDEHKEETRQWRDKIEVRLDKTEEQLFLYKTVIKIIKWGVGLLVAVLTLKFGDIPRFFGYDG